MNKFKFAFLIFTLLAGLFNVAQAKSNPDKEMYDLRVDISVMEKKLATMGVDVNINEVPSYGSQYLQNQALRSQHTKLQSMLQQLN